VKSVPEGVVSVEVAYNSIRFLGNVEELLLLGDFLIAEMNTR
jgi:hypothetical protein